MSSPPVVGWHGPTGSQGMSDPLWAILANVPPAAFLFQHGERITERDIERILAINPKCQFFMRIYRRFVEPVDHRAYIDYAKSAILPGSWEVIPEGQRNLQIYNEQNMPHTTTPPGHPLDQWEGFGPSIKAMESFNEWFCLAWHELKETNPTWRICFPPLTAGNMDAYFHTDPIGKPYYMHGPEAAFGDPCSPSMDGPTSKQIEAARASCPCGPALELAEVYLAHIYVINDVDFQMRELWAGMRWLQYLYFLVEPKPVFITELGIKGPQQIVDYHELLRTQYPQVWSSCIWKVGDEPYDRPSNPHVVALRDYVRSLPPAPARPLPPPVVPGTPDVPDPPEPPQGGQQLRAFVGLQLRNDNHIPTADGAACVQGKIEACKVMNFTIRDQAVPEIQRILNPTWLVRLWDGRFGVGGQHPSPTQFVEGARGGIEHWRSLTPIYEIHNEPNHQAGIEGWGPGAINAGDYAAWHAEVYDRLKALYPELLFGFPGLAPGAQHSDLMWLEICRDVIEQKADWLGCHTYWQNLDDDNRNHLSEEWGLRYRQYLSKFPDKLLMITEFANTQGIDGYPVSYHRMGEEYAEYLEQVMADSWDHERGILRIAGAYSFICSSGDPTWHPVSWQVGGGVRPIASLVGEMERPPLRGSAPIVPPEDTRTLGDKVRQAVWNATGQQVPYNPNAALTRYAYRIDADPPFTPEVEVKHDGQTYIGQGWNGVILVVKKDEWGQIQAIEWIEAIQ